MVSCSSVIGSLRSFCEIAAGRGVGGSSRNGVRGLFAEAAFVRVYCGNPPPATVRNSEAPAALIRGGGAAAITMGVVLNDGKIEKAGRTLGVVGAPSVGGP